MNPSIELQKQIRDNAEDVRSFVSDLRNWEEEMRKKEDECHSASSSSVDYPIPAVRNNSKKRDCSDSTDSQCSEDIHGAKKRISSDDYAAWEKFDVDKACQEIDSSVKAPETPLVSEDEARVTENKLRDEANYEKEKGNQFVKKMDWDCAIECYSRAIKCYPRDAIFFCNRALCFLKKRDYRSAETDCTSALALDCTYIKALHRRGLARRELNQLREARADLKTAMELEPSNTTIRRDYNAVNTTIVETQVEQIFGGEVVHSASELVFDLGNVLQEPVDADLVTTSDRILPAKKHRLIASQSKLVSNKLEWPKVDDADVVEPVHIPPHRRSKKALKRVDIEEVSSMSKSLITEISPAVVKSTPVVEVSHVPLTSRTQVQSPSIRSSSTEKIIEKKINLPAAPKVLPHIPKNSVQFLAGWRQVRGDNDLSFKYLKQISGKDVAVIFRDSLDGNILSEIIQTLASQFVEASEPVLEYLSGLARVKRFRTLTMFLTAKDKKNISQLFNYAQSSEGASCEVLSSLKKQYEL